MATGAGTCLTACRRVLTGEQTCDWDGCGMVMYSGERYILRLALFFLTRMSIMLEESEEMKGWRHMVIGRTMMQQSRGPSACQVGRKRAWGTARCGM